MLTIVTPGLPVGGGGEVAIASPTPVLSARQHDEAPPAPQISPLHVILLVHRAAGE